MECERCGGLMVSEKFYDLLDSQIDFRGYRCLVCGEILDAMILKHRQNLEPALVQ